MTEINGWACESDDVIVIVGAGESKIKAIRETDSDASYATGRIEEIFDKLSEERDDYWCVVLQPSSVSPDELDADPAVRAYQVCETNGGESGSVTEKTAMAKLHLVKTEDGEYFLQGTGDASRQANFSLFDWDGASVPIGNQKWAIVPLSGLECGVEYDPEDNDSFWQAQTQIVDAAEEAGIDVPGYAK